MSRPPPTSHRSRGANRRRFAATLAAALALGVLAGGCSDGDGASGGTGQAATAPVAFDFGGTAATVGGEQIPAQVLADTLGVFQAAPGAVKPAFGEDQLFQADSDQPQPAIVANILSTEIAAKLIEAEATARGVAVPPEVEAVAETQVKAAFGDSLDGQTSYRDHLIRRYSLYVALDQALAPPAPDDAALRQAYDADPARFADQACARHILVGTEAEAADIAAQVGAGADFAALARARSTDPGSGAEGGDLGCQARGSYVPEFEAAVWDGPLGQVQGPVKSQFGFHLIVVDARGQLTFEQARPQLADELAPAPFEALRTWLGERFAGTPVDVDARYGTWNPQAGLVDPVGVQTTGLEITPDTTPTTG